MLMSSFVSQYGSEDLGCAAAAGFIEGCGEGAALDEALNI